MPFSTTRATTIGIAALVATGVLVTNACVGDEPVVDSADASNDSSITSDASLGGDGGSDASAGATYTSSLADQTMWEKLDIASLSTGPFLGGAYDGRYIYYVPTSAPSVSNTVLVRYDTHAAFTDVNSWNYNDLSAFGDTFAGAIYAPPYLYLIPHTSADGGAHDGTFVRYDTRADFKMLSSYSAFDLTTKVSANDHEFSPGAFDGKFAYMGPVNGPNAARFDTTAPFDAGASYQSVGMNSGGSYYSGSCFDGTHVYYVPAATVTGTTFGLVKQYSTTASFTTPGSFVGYDLSDGGLDPKAAGFNGCAFDGHYLYFEPYGINMGSQGFASLVVRYDTTAAFASIDSYSKFELKGVDANAHGFHGATFDGRYLYFAPFTLSTAVRFDTIGSFGDKAAWQSYDLTTSLTANAHAYAGAVFDGEYVYFVPYGTTLAVRFHARSPAALPAFASSFY